MNIKFGMDNFYTRYLKRFLNHELDRSTSILGSFEKNDLKDLIKYLNYPNTKTIFEVQRELVENFPKLKTLFTMNLIDDEIVWTSKAITKETAEFLRANSERIDKYCKSVGWKLGSISSWIDSNMDINSDGNVDETDRYILNDIINNNTSGYDETTIRKADINLDGFRNYEDLNILNNYLVDHKLYISVINSGRENYFPNEDMKIFINQFTGEFLYNYAIRSEDGPDDVVHYTSTNKYKIGLFECKPGEKLTIAHNCTNSEPSKLIIGCTSKIQKQNLIGTMLTDVVEVELKPGEYYQYTTTIDSDRESRTLDAHWVCIQCPSDYDNITGHNQTTIMLEVGDINFDGKIDNEDYMLLAQYTAEGAGADQLPYNKANWTPTDKQLAVMNCRTDTEWHRDRINVDDAVYLWDYINGQGGIIDLGLTPYTIDTYDTNTNGKNVSNLLIIEGHYNSDVNIPFLEFAQDDWVIHEKFFNYLLDMAVHKYSNSEDVTYIQKLLRQVYDESYMDKNFFNIGEFDDFMREKLKEYQSKQINYTKGDLNKDNKIDNSDLELMRQYVDDANDYTLVCKYLIDPIKYPLTEEQILALDQDGDGVITENDKTILNNRLNELYSPTLRSRADVNDDGFVDETDYQILQDIVDNGYATIIDLNGNTKYIDLKNYDISFQLGWLDVQTEKVLEYDVNTYGDISEVSK